MMQLSHLTTTHGVSSSPPMKIISVSKRHATPLEPSIIISPNRTPYTFRHISGAATSDDGIPDISHDMSGAATSSDGSPGISHGISGAATSDDGNPDISHGMCGAAGAATRDDVTPWRRLISPGSQL